MEIGSAIGLVGKEVESVGQAAGTATTGAQTSLGNLDLKSPPSDVAKNISARLLQGDTVGARSYLADQAGISPTEADQRLQDFKNQAQTTARNVGGTAAGAVSVAAWAVFGVLFLGNAIAVLGGGMGTIAENRRLE